MVLVAQKGVGSSASPSKVGGQAPFRLAVGFAVATLVLMGVFNAAEWYADRVSIPRYCGNPDATLELVRVTLSEPRPAPEASTRPYVVAAKLIYLVPQKSGESVETYLARLRLSIAESCR